MWNPILKKFYIYDNNNKVTAEAGDQYQTRRLILGINITAVLCIYTCEAFNAHKSNCTLVKPVYISPTALSEENKSPLSYIMRKISQLHRL